MPVSSTIIKPAELNEAQWKAVTHPRGHLLIVAGPGTGKTHTLTFRIALKAQVLSPEQRILAITFTNKAAEEMRQRLTGRIPSLSERVTVGTFHSFCHQLLSQYKELSGLPADFQLAQPEQIEALMKIFWPDKTLGQIRSRLNEISQWKACRSF